MCVEWEVCQTQDTQLIRIHITFHIYIYIYVCVCVCVVKETKNKGRVVAGDFVYDAIKHKESHNALTKNKKILKNQTTRSRKWMSTLDKMSDYTRSDPTS